jgi:hypothetical protein
VNDARTVIRASEVRPGDRLRLPGGGSLTVTRIDEGFMGRPELLAFVEDSDVQWVKLTAPRQGEVELAVDGGAESAA